MLKWEQIKGRPPGSIAFQRRALNAMKGKSRDPAPPRESGFRWEPDADPDPEWAPEQPPEPEHSSAVGAAGDATVIG